MRFVRRLQHLCVLRSVVRLCTELWLLVVWRIGLLELLGRFGSIDIHAGFVWRLLPAKLWMQRQRCSADR